ncbi:MAG: S-layer homology domain-containing protein [Eubacteriales bacterium]
MFAGAAFTDSADIKVKSEVVDTLVELGVIQGYDDGSFRPNETVTRAQMAKMIYVLRTGNSDASAYNDDYTTFTDISTHWGRGYIKYCQSLGIIAGKSATVFAPDVKVTTQEAAKMLLVTLGYDAKKAGLVGTGWASKTNALADENGLLEDVNTSFSGPCPRQYAAQLIYNTIDAPTVVWRDDAYHHTNVLDKDNQTVGEKYMGLKKTVATLTNVTKTSGKDTYELTLDNRNAADSTDGADAIMSFTDVAKDYSALKYKTVTVLHKDRKTVFGVYATDDNSEKTGLLKNLKMDSTSKVKLSGTKYDLAAAAKQTVYVNGDVLYVTATSNVATEGAFTTDTTKAASTTTTSGTTTSTVYTKATIKDFVDAYGDGATLKYKNAAYLQGTSVSLLATDGTSNYSILNVKTYAVGKVTNVGSDYVNVSWKAGDKSFTETKCNDDDWDWYDGIKKDDYVIMTADGNYASGHGLIEKADVVSGKVTAVKSTDAVSVGGNWYTMAGRDNSNDSTVANQYNSMVARPNTNSTVDMVVVNGYVYFTDTTKGSIEDVALLVEAAAKGGTGSKWEARLIFSDGSDKTVDIEKNWEDKDNKTNPITDMDESDSPILVTYTVSKDVYTLTKIGANHTYDGDTSYETAGYDAYVANNGTNIVTDGSVKGGTFTVTNDKGQNVVNVARMYYEATGSVFVKYDGTPVDAQGHALVANPNGTGYVLASDRTTTAVLKGFDDASYKVITGKAASNYDKKTLTEVKAVADKSGNSYYAQAAYINLGALKSGGNSDKTYAVATSDSGKDTSNGTVYTVTGWNGTEELTFKAEDSFGTLKAGDVFEYSALGNDLYDIDKVNAGEYYVNSYDKGTGDIELYDVVSGKPGTLQADTATLNKTKVDSKDTTVIYVNSDDGKGAAATEIKAAYIFDADSWSNGKLPTLANMQLTNGKVVDSTDATNFLTEDNAPNVKAYFDDDDQITLLVVDINNNITQW